MYSLCFDEDLAGEIASELRLDREKARAIAAELMKLRGAAPLLIMKRSMRRSIKETRTVSAPKYRRRRKDSASPASGGSLSVEQVR
jgi:hypothetical protein